MSNERVDNPCDDSKGDCSKAASLVDRYIDNVLDDGERSFIAQHLSDCPGCNHGYEFESTFHARVQSLEPIQMPQSVRENIMLSLGFPGMSDPMSGTFSSLGTQDARIDGDISSQFGIPQGEIPRGEIPRSDFFTDESDSSSDESL
ncbi:MAG TPA: zf-HC2 domain-containing protein [Acidimicrobiia bacterium]|nr:zf-HC2 domain-containing protein [Acidimicrobiia bacterium]